MLRSSFRTSAGVRSPLSISVNRRLLLSLLSLVALIATVVAIQTPAMAGGSFDDDDGNIHERAIEAIARAGITKGCDDGEFCPDAPVTRGQMAAFLVRAFELGGDGDGGFGDIDDSIFERDIRLLKAHDVTKGCNPPGNDRYCPDRTLTRGEMAAFLVRVADLGEPGEGPTFDDSGSSVHEDAIRRLADEGVTKGCNPPENDRFCPNRRITRAEMATFLVRILDLPTPEVPGGGGGSDDPDLDDPVNPKIEIPGDAIRIEPGSSIQAASDKHGDGATFVIAAGVHRGQEVSPDSDQTFIGEKGAVMIGEGRKHAFSSHADGVTIHNIEITGYSPGDKEGAIHAKGGDDWLVFANRVHHNDEIGIKSGDGWQVVDNHVHHNGRYGIQGAGDNIVIQGNEISFNSTDYGATGASGGTKFVLTDDLVLRGNHVHDNFGNGLWIDINNSDSLVVDNVVVDNDLNGINVEISCGALIVGNHIEGNGFGDDYDNWMTGAGVLVSNSPGVEVRNNTFVHNKMGVGGIHWGHPNRGSVSKCQPSLKNYKVRNNSFDQSDGAAAGIDAKIDTGNVWSGWGNQFSGNSYDLDNGAGFRWEGDWLSLNQWKSEGLG